MHTKDFSKQWEMLAEFPVTQVGWAWTVKAREGKETAEHDWVAETREEAAAKMQELYPQAKITSVKRRYAVYNDSWLRYMPLEGYIYYG